MAESILKNLSRMAPDIETPGISFVPVRQLEGRTRHLRSPLHQRRLCPNRWSEACGMMTAVMLIAVTFFEQSATKAIAAPEPPISSVILVQVDDAAPRTTVKVFDLDGRPIKHGTVQLLGDTRSGAYFDQTISIRDGIAVVPLKSMEVEQMSFAIKAPGYLTHRRKYSPEKADLFLKVAPQYTFKLKSGISIGGQVVSQNGTPVVNADVHAMCPTVGDIERGFDTFDQHVSTDENGKWEMSGAPDGLEHLTLRITHGAELAGEDSVTRIAVSPSDRDQLISFADVRTLNVPLTTTATVRDPEGRPVAGALVLFAGRDFYRDGAAKQIPKTDANGTFQLPATNSGSVLFTIFSPNWALHPLKVTFPLKSPLKITLQKGHRVAFRALDSQGQPVAGIHFYPEAPRLARFEGHSDVNYLYVLDYLGHRHLLKNVSDENGNFVWENAPRERLAYQIVSSHYLSQPGGDYGPTDAPHTLHFRPNIPLNISIVDDTSGQSITDYKVHMGTHFKANRADRWSWNFERPLKANPPGRYPAVLRCLDRTIQYRIEAEGYQPGTTPIYDAKELPDSPITVEVRLKKLEP